MGEGIGGGDRSPGLCEDLDQTAIAAGGSVGTESDQADTESAIAAAAADRLGEQTIGGQTFGPDRGSGLGPGDRGAAVAAGCAGRSKGDQGDRVPGIAADATDALGTDAIGVVAERADSSVVDRLGPAAVAADIAVAGIAEQTIAAAAIAGSAAKTLGKDTDGTVAPCGDRSVAGRRGTAAVIPGPAGPAADRQNSVTTQTTPAAAALGHNAVRQVTRGRDLGNVRGQIDRTSGPAGTALRACRAEIAVTARAAVAAKADGDDARQPLRDRGNVRTRGRDRLDHTRPGCPRIPAGRRDKQGPVVATVTGTAG